MKVQNLREGIKFNTQMPSTEKAPLRSVVGVGRPHSSRVENESTQPSASNSWSFHLIFSFFFFFFLRLHLGVPVVAQRKGIRPGTMRLQV